MAKFVLIAILVVLVAMVSRMGWSDQKPATANYDETDGRSMPFILDGEDAIPHEFPWTVLIAMVFNNRIYTTCTGSLIFPQVVLTAGHCLWHNRTTGQIPYGLSAVVYPGQHKHLLKRWKGRYAPKGVNSMELIVPLIPKPYKDYGYFDYGVIILSKPLKRSRTVDFIPLANPRSQLPQRLSCYAAGFGRYDVVNGTVARKLNQTDQKKLGQYIQSLRPDVLQKIPLWVLPTRRCYFIGIGGDGYLIRAKMMEQYSYCGMPARNDSPGVYPGVFHGDSGGPLMCRHSQSEPWVLYGLISGGKEHCIGWREYRYCVLTPPRKPQLFARVPAISNWLKEIGSAYELHQTQFRTTSTTKATFSSFRALAAKVMISESRQTK